VPQEAKVMAVINEWTEAALDRGLSPFLRILRRTVGDFPAEVEEQIRKLSKPQLEDLADAMPTISSLLDLNEWLARHG
jgi:hypothetical protein